jgi:predicted GIY-YIG superfamily endonuclease
MRQPVVYILASATGRALDIGITTDMSRRLEEHRLGRVIHTAKYKIDRLIIWSLSKLRRMRSLVKSS